MEHKPDQKQPRQRRKPRNVPVVRIHFIPFESEAHRRRAYQVLADGLVDALQSGRLNGGERRE